MPIARNAIQRGLLLGACAMSATAISTHAIADDANAGATRPAASSACEAARQQAWFERQLRMTEGDTAPLRPAEPAACAPVGFAQGEQGAGGGRGAGSAKHPKDRR